MSLTGFEPNSFAAQPINRLYTNWATPPPRTTIVSYLFKGTSEPRIIVDPPIFVGNFMTLSVANLHSVQW
jgi:hypothetical protein